MSVCPSVRMEHTGSHETNFYEIWYFSIFRKSVEKIEFSLKSERKMGTLLEDQHIFLIISRSPLLRVRNISDRSSRET